MPSLIEVVQDLFLLATSHPVFLHNQLVLDTFAVPVVSCWVMGLNYATAIFTLHTRVFLIILLLVELASDLLQLVNHLGF